MDERYARLATPPVSALGAIKGGRNKGKTDINPQWKYEAMTEVYGLCGLGWKFAIDETNIIDLPNGEKMIFMKVALHIKDGDGWSEPIYGYGGDFIVKEENAGKKENARLYADDEAYKKCLTDALGNAMKNIGVAADVYKGMFETKYNGEVTRKDAAEETQNTGAENKKEPANRKLAELISVVAENGINPDYFCELLYNANKEELSIDQINYVLEDLNRAFTEFQKRDAARHEEIPM